MHITLSNTFSLVSFHLTYTSNFFARAYKEDEFTVFKLSLHAVNKMSNHKLHRWWQYIWSHINFCCTKETALPLINYYLLTHSLYSKDKLTHPKANTIHLLCKLEYVQLPLKIQEIRKIWCIHNSHISKEIL